MTLHVKIPEAVLAQAERERISVDALIARTMPHFTSFLAERVASVFDSFAACFP